MWIFQEYKSGADKCPVSEWHEELSPISQARIDKFMAIARIQDQLGPDFQNFHELLEARLWGENRVPHRIFCYISSHRYVTFLCGCTHRGKKYKPTNAYDTAIRRRKEIEEKGAKTRELAFEI